VSNWINIEGKNLKKKDLKERKKNQVNLSEPLKLATLELNRKAQFPTNLMLKKNNNLKNFPK